VAARRDHPAAAVREPEQDALVAGADGQRLRAVVEPAGVLEEERDHPELPHLALDVLKSVPLRDDRADRAEQVRLLEVADVAELRVPAGEGDLPATRRRGRE